MPPKRKRAAAEPAQPEPAAPAKARRSTRKNGTSANGVPEDEPDAVEISNTKPTKKPRTAAAKKTKTMVNEDSKTAPVKPPTSKKPKQNDLDPKSYTPARVTALFADYADEDDPGSIGTEGLEKLCGDAELSMEGPSPFILAWLLKADNFGTFTKEEWEKGLCNLRIDTTSKLHLAVGDIEELFYGSPSKNSPMAFNPNTDPYSRYNLMEIGTDVTSAFKTFYQFCFGLAKKEGQRIIEMEMATAIWSVLLQPKYPIIEQFIGFINAHPNHKAVNKDVWMMTFEFCEAMKDVDIASYDDDESWPSILDEFVAWEKKRLNGDS